MFLLVYGMSLPAAWMALPTYWFDLLDGSTYVSDHSTRVCLSPQDDIVLSQKKWLTGLELELPKQAPLSLKGTQVAGLDVAVEIVDDIDSLLGSKWIRSA